MKKLVTFFVTIGGIAEFAIGLLHFVMAYNIDAKLNLLDIPEVGRNFILLNTLAVGCCLIVFGFLTILFVKKLRYLDKPSIIFCISQGALWLGRIILEIILPIRITLLGIQSISIYVIIASILLSTLYFSVLSLLIYDTNQ